MWNAVADKLVSMVNNSLIYSIKIALLSSFLTNGEMQFFLLRMQDTVKEKTGLSRFTIPVGMRFHAKYKISLICIASTFRNIMGLKDSKLGFRLI